MKERQLTFKIVLTASLLLFINLLFLFYIKYSDNQLSIKDFSILKSGNIINSVFVLTAIVGLSISYYRKINISDKVLYFLIGLLYVFLFLVVILHYLTLPRREYYLYTLSFSQVLVLAALGSYQFIQLFLIMLIWLKIFDIQNFIVLRASVNSIFILLGLLVFTLIFINTRFSNNNELMSQTSPKVAVVLGAAVWSNNQPSPSLAARVDKAAMLFQEGNIDKIQLTGGSAPGELSESEVALRYILKKKINRDDIWIEKNTTSSIEQVRFIRNELIKMKGLNSVAIVSDIYHLKRVQEICNFFNINARMISSDLRLKTDRVIFYQLRECVALLMFWLFGL